VSGSALYPIEHIATSICLTRQTSASKLALEIAQRDPMFAREVETDIISNAGVCIEPHGCLLVSMACITSVCGVALFP